MRDKIYNETCLTTLGRMDNNSIDCVVTSPPYWQLRDYGYAGQWGLEPTYQKYLEHLWSMMDEIYRVLKPEGTVWVNLGDTYFSKPKSSNSGGLQNNSFGNNDSQHGYKNNADTYKNNKELGLKDKCLLLIPHRFAIGCIERGWIVRNDIIWAKRNGMPESVTDRFSKKHEYFFFMVKSEKYYFDLDAVRDRQCESSINRYKYEFNAEKYREVNGAPQGMKYQDGIIGKNPGSVSDFWDGYKKPTFEEYMRQCAEYYYSIDDFFDIPTKPSSNEHYAAYNDKLIAKPVLAGCPEGGVIYDPFMGTGSTAEVAIRANRHYLGSEMSEKYCQIADKRLSPFKTQITFI